MRGFWAVLAALASGCGAGRAGGEDAAGVPAMEREAAEDAGTTAGFAPPPVRDAGASPPAGEVASRPAPATSAATSWSAENCTNGVDDDGDGLIDCEDGECLADSACTEDCTNGADDDGDGLADCEDGACAGDSACTEWHPVRLKMGSRPIRIVRNATADRAGTCKFRLQAGGGGGIEVLDGSTVCGFSSKGWLTWTMNSATSTALCEEFSFFTRPAVWGTVPTLSSGCPVSPVWEDLAPGALLPQSFNPFGSVLYRGTDIVVGAFPGTAATFTFSAVLYTRSYTSNRNSVLFSEKGWAHGDAWTVPARVVR